MARPKLSNISLSSLQAEIQRRTSKLKALVAQRDELNCQIEEIEGMLGVSAADGVGGKRRRRRRRRYDQTAEAFVMGMLKGKGATTADINKAWAKAGRPGRADNTLNKLSNAKLVKREKLVGKKGSRYTAA